jgi:hypothetical protein
MIKLKGWNHFVLYGMQRKVWNGRIGRKKGLVGKIVTTNFSIQKSTWAHTCAKILQKPKVSLLGKKNAIELQEMAKWRRLEYARRSPEEVK